MPDSSIIKETLLPLFLLAGESDTLRAESLGFWRRGEERFWLPRFTFRRTRVKKSRIKIGLFATIHGDEPAGLHALIDFVRLLAEDPMLGRDYDLRIYPLCNPTGFIDGTRHSRSGLDLNREFWNNSSEPEVELLEKELLTQKFDGIIALHSDDTSEGVYGFVKGATLTEHLLKPSLAAAAHLLPTNLSNQIDGFHAVEGIIRSGYPGILAAPPEISPTPFEIILETPALSPMDLQRQVFVLALSAILGEYRKLISYGGDL
ncbi:MAG TPA: succinylglutamate desuccinylase/aspartoacylase family protein [Chthoniobacterales bacterium]